PLPPGRRLVADIGGTNARFALLTGDALHDERVLKVDDYPGIVEAIEAYLASVHSAAGAERPVEAAIAIANPITGDLIRMTNHFWEFSAAGVRRILGFARMIFVNDFTALAMALRHLPPAELEQVGGGRGMPGAPYALIGPGTGLGVSGLIPAGDWWVPLQGEGGHATLSPANEREMDVIRILRQRFSHVSAERVLCGPGLVNLYEALCLVEGRAPEVLEPRDITRRAVDGTCRTCRETLTMFCGMLGTVAGNLVLTLGALGGLFVGGGIVPNLGRFFASSPFRDHFEDKGRFADYLAPVPVWVIHTDRPAFVGVARTFDNPGPRLEVIG
ncbi:MAG TPA: glucokinase, partial [Steroidobacteraceae bacterium]|nr:glucokinase [Steroidobacteraceae bacterium]